MAKTKEEILNDNGAGGYVADKRYRQLFGHREKLYKAMDEYARQEAIEFNHFAITYFLGHIKGEEITDEQLYQLFITSKTK